MDQSKKDLSGKIVGFLRENGGEAEIGVKVFSKRVGGSRKSCYVALSKLCERKIIILTQNAQSGPMGPPARYRLVEDFLASDSWREVYASYNRPKGRSKGSKNRPKQISSAVMPPQSTMPVQLETDEIDLNLGHHTEMVRAYEEIQRLRAERDQNPLRQEIVGLQEQLKVARQEIADLSEQLAMAHWDRERHKQNAATAERRLALRLGELRKEVGPLRPFELSVDASGVMLEKKAI